MVEKPYLLPIGSPDYRAPSTAEETKERFVQDALSAGRSTDYAEGTWASIQSGRYSYDKVYARDLGMTNPKTQVGGVDVQQGWQGSRPVTVTGTPLPTNTTANLPTQRELDARMSLQKPLATPVPQATYEKLGFVGMSTPLGGVMFPTAEAARGMQERQGALVAREQEKQGYYGASTESGAVFTKYEMPAVELPAGGFKLAAGTPVLDVRPMPRPTEESIAIAKERGETFNYGLNLFALGGVALAGGAVISGGVALAGPALAESTLLGTLGAFATGVTARVAGSTFAPRVAEAIAENPVAVQRFNTVLVAGIPTLSGAVAYSGARKAGFSESEARVAGGKAFVESGVETVGFVKGFGAGTRAVFPEIKVSPNVAPDVERIDVFQTAPARYYASYSGESYPASATARSLIGTRTVTAQGGRFSGGILNVDNQFAAKGVSEGGTREVFTPNWLGRVAGFKPTDEIIVARGGVFGRNNPAIAYREDIIGKDIEINELPNLRAIKPTKTTQVYFTETPSDQKVFGFSETAARTQRTFKGTVNVNQLGGTQISEERFVEFGKKAGVSERKALMEYTSNLDIAGPKGALGKAQTTSYVTVPRANIFEIPKEPKMPVIPSAEKGAKELSGLLPETASDDGFTFLGGEGIKPKTPFFSEPVKTAEGAPAEVGGGQVALYRQTQSVASAKSELSAVEKSVQEQVAKQLAVMNAPEALAQKTSLQFAPLAFASKSATAQKQSAPTRTVQDAFGINQRIRAPSSPRLDSRLQIPFAITSPRVERQIGAPQKTDFGRPFQDQLQIPRQLQRQIQRTDQPPVPVTRTFDFGPPTIPTDGGGIDFPFGASKSAGKGARGSLGLKSRYVPSLVGFLSGITVSKPSRVVTGAEVRYPIANKMPRAFKKYGRNFKFFNKRRR